MMQNTDLESKFICPRPRNPRACDKCRTRKIRCLPAGTGCGGCRRCAKLGYSCSYTQGSPSRPQQGPISPPQSLDHDSRQNEEDLVSGLFQNKPPSAGGLDQLLDLHHRIFQEQSYQDSPLNPASMLTPESLAQTSAFELDSSSPDMDTNISMQKADTLLTLFRQRNSYFPFITIPETTSAASMAIHQPFLLLAVLTVSSSRMPRLQQRTDERFRRVLSERIILHGEKGLDYVQGLLVYIAWCPLHLRPLRNQLSQYIQIVNTMISDLDLDTELHKKSKEERDACLGCYTLSSLDEIQEQYLRLQYLAARVARYTASVRLTAQGLQAASNLSSAEESVLEKMALFTGELEDLSSSLFASNTRRKIPIRFTQQFIRMNITSLPLEHLLQPSPNHIPLSADPNLNLTTSYFSEIQAFLELFLSIPPEEYVSFSIQEWSQLILTISFTSNLCFSPCPFECALEDIPRLLWTEFQAKTRAKMLIYLESLAHRMGDLSVLMTTPDSFCMLKSVLGILVRTYTPDSSFVTSIPATRQEDAGSNSSRCPILNGSIQQTDFWRALEQSTSTSQDGYVDRGLGVDDLINHPQDWPSIFSEWVVDLNHLPE
ncbi:hypothetical protein BJX76DRAFT_345840 [Aspergillus varians]